LLIDQSGELMSVLVRVVAFGVACSLPALALAAETHGCETKQQPSNYQPRPGDISTSTQLDLARPFRGTGDFTINICTGELHIERVEHASQLHLSVRSSTADRTLGKYLQELDLAETNMILNLGVPSEFHPIVTLSIPSSATLHSTINLGAGTLELSAHHFAGDREINLGAGTARITLDGDRNYSSLQAHIGMGTFKDNRPGGHNSHFVVSRSMEGTGNGLLEVSVGAGEVVLDPAK
jgi:hypothetical protein